MTGKLNHLLFLSAVFIRKLSNLYLGRLRNDPRHRQRLKCRLSVYLMRYSSRDMVYSLLVSNTQCTSYHSVIIRRPNLKQNHLKEICASVNKYSYMYTLLQGHVYILCVCSAQLCLLFRNSGRFRLTEKEYWPKQIYLY